LAGVRGTTATQVAAQVAALCICFRLCEYQQQKDTASQVAAVGMSQVAAVGMNVIKHMVLGFRVYGLGFRV
jgi:hypothetical protein